VDRAAIAAVCFGERIGTFETSEAGADGMVAPRNNDARQLTAAITETFVCFRATMFNFPWYRYFRTPTYQRFERAANTMRQYVYTALIYSRPLAGLALLKT